MSNQQSRKERPESKQETASPKLKGGGSKPKPNSDKALEDLKSAIKSAEKVAEEINNELSQDIFEFAKQHKICLCACVVDCGCCFSDDGHILCQDCLDILKQRDNIRQTERFTDTVDGLKAKKEEYDRYGDFK